MGKKPMMRFIVALASLLALGAAAGWADPPSQVGRLSLISGEVSFHPGSLDEWAPATLNYPLSAGDHLWTDSGARAEVQLLSAAVRLNSGTEFSFLGLDDQRVQVRLSEGSLNVNLRSVDEGMAFEIDTPNAAISLQEPGRYRIDVLPAGETTVTARSGTAQVSAGGDSFDVPAGQSTVVSGADSVAYYVTEAASPDEWDAWCAERDRRGERVSVNPYVSREMIGAEDLSDNGTWIVASGFGPAWAPANVPAGWAPYRYGHWSWVEPWGWTWIDDMAWGFAPFHYGRWAFLNARWVWVPGAAVARPVYAPALVVFVGGEGWTPAAGAGIGWFPLGPREVYVPPYRVSPAYVQRINVAHVSNFNQQAIERYDPNHAIYVNRTAPQGVTFVTRDVFVQSRPAGGSFLHVSPTEITRAPIGMTAAVAPQRESIIAQPLPQRNPVPQPLPSVMTRRVYSRTAPPPPQVPFSERQQVLRENPGRPIDPDTYSRMQRNQRVATPPVTVVRPIQPQRLAPGGPQRVITPPPDDQQKRPLAPAPAGPRQQPQAPGGGDQPRVLRPAPAQQVQPPANADQPRANMPAQAPPQQQTPASREKGKPIKRQPDDQQGPDDQ